MASFRAKIGWERPRQSEKKKISFHFIPTQSEIEKSIKIAKKFKNLKNNIMASFQTEIGQ